MALRKYKNLKIYREYLNLILPLNFPDAQFTGDEVIPQELETQGVKMKFEEGPLSGVECRIHNYMMYVIFPDGYREKYPFFKQRFNFTVSEINLWVKSEGQHLRLYPRDRNNYDDTELSHKQRAIYFVSSLFIILKWVQREMENELSILKSIN